MILDMIHIHRLSDPRHLIEFTQIVGERGIVGNAANVALKVAHVDRIKAYKGGEESVKSRQSASVICAPTK